MQIEMPRVRRTISVFTLAMINVAAIGSVKNWPITAEFGLASITYILLATVVFFIPTALISAELATAWPERGGIYAWVRRAFGHRTGFLAIWLYWVQNLFWYPTILSFMAATTAYIFFPEYATNKVYLVSVILAGFWIATFANLLGMKASAEISSLSVILGVFIPGGLIILFGFLAYAFGMEFHVPLHLPEFIPRMNSYTEIAFFTGVLLSIVGMEMSAVHAKDVKHPQRDYPLAILVSGIIIIGSTIVGVLAIASVVPHESLSLVTGFLQAFSYFANHFGVPWLTPIVAALTAIGAFGAISTWIIGPSKGLLAAAQSGDLPPLFRTVNAKGMPVFLLMVQALFVTALSLLFILMEEISGAFWILTVITAQLYMIIYILLFAAALRLRYTYAQKERPYRIPGGRMGMWLISSVGILSAAFAIIVGFLPPPTFASLHLVYYESFLFGGIVFSCIAPWIILLFQKPHWKQALKHEDGHE